MSNSNTSKRSLLCDQSKKLPSLATIWKVLTGRYERTGPSGLYNIIKLLPFRLHTLIFCFHFGIKPCFPNHREVLTCHMTFDMVWIHSFQSLKMIIVKTTKTQGCQDSPTVGDYHLLWGVGDTYGGKGNL